MSAIRSNNPEMRLAGIRMLGQIGDASSVETLAEFLFKDEKESKAAVLALCRLPREAVGQAMLDLLKKSTGRPGPPLDVLGNLKYHEAMDTLTALAQQDNPDVHNPTLVVIGEIANPDDADLSHLVRLLLSVQGERREAVERVIWTVCQRLAKDSVRINHISTAGSSEIVIQESSIASTGCPKPLEDVLAKLDASEMPKYLPLLGRFGGEQTLKTIDASLASKKPERESAAVLALCHWPDVSVADRLWVVANGGNPEYRPLALHAYVRLVTRKSGRPVAETLAMLQKAMTLSKSPVEQQWVLHRASNVRTMDAVVWIASYLEDPEVNQTACESIVALAHHRLLRQPNMDRFGPLLEKICRISKNAKVVEQAQKDQLGL
jgi:hypothetical protein